MNKAVLCLSAALTMGAGQLAHAAAADPALSSLVENIALVALDELPAAPAEQGDIDYCSHLALSPASAGGKTARSADWIVTGETVLGDYDVVSFVGGFVAGTSGACEKRDGNVGLFRSGSLVALAYARDTSAGTIGSIEPLEGGSVRLWDGDYLPYPVADLTIDGDAVAITAPASVDTVCGGAAEVPNINGMPIAEAREKLQSYGWTPAGGIALEEFDGAAAELREYGLTEVEGCSGTGMGFCSFLYEGSAGRLSVTTAGDPPLPQTPSVTAYAVSCNTAG